MLMALVAGPASAADLSRAAPAPVYTKAPMMAPAFSWSGCYIGGHGGGAWSSSDYTFTNNVGVAEALSFNPNSWVAGAQVGCQVQVSSWVLGIEGTWSGMDLKQTDASRLVVPATRSLKIDEEATITGKLGYAWDRYMIYGKGGFADVRVNTASFNPANSIASDTTNWQGGWTIGGGFEFSPWQSIVLGVEYDYTRVNFDRSGSFTPAGTGPFTVRNSTANISTILGRVSFLFNPGFSR